jgi:3-phenylpropionate/trans-cinnamate dioxygenase alpha subunit
MWDYKQLVDRANHTISPHVWTNFEIYRRELERVFYRSWLYVGHESQLPEPGSFITTHMGEEPAGVAGSRRQSAGLSQFLQASGDETLPPR